MDAPPSLKVSATIHGRRYTACLAGEQVLIVGDGRPLATCRWTPQGFRELRPAGLDHFTVIPAEDIGVVDQLETALRSALSRPHAAGA